MTLRQICRCPGPAFIRWLPLCMLMMGGMLAVCLKSAPAGNPFLGRWALTIPDGRAGWLEVTSNGGRLAGSLLWGGGSVLPLASVTMVDGVLTVTRVRELPRKNDTGKVVRTEKITETITARADGDSLKLTYAGPRPIGTGSEGENFSGRRIPALPPRPDLTSVKFGPAISLLNGRDLAGWRVKETDAPNGWSVAGGVLVNRPAVPLGAKRGQRSGNLRTEREFEDGKLSLEVSVPAESNSGVYLRGIYEIQVSDSHGKPLDSHNMGAVYSRLAPAMAAEKPAGEWQTLELTLVDRHMTVVLNGKTIIDNQPLLGCTGGAMWSDEFRPGPIVLQGDHGVVSYRNLGWRPVVR